jgi:hypothetical protein
MKEPLGSPRTREPFSVSDLRREVVGDGRACIKSFTDILDHLRKQSKAPLGRLSERSYPTVALRFQKITCTESDYLSENISFSSDELA